VEKVIHVYVFIFILNLPLFEMERLQSYISSSLSLEILNPQKALCAALKIQLRNKDNILK